MALPLMRESALSLDGVSKSFKRGSSITTALEDVSFNVSQGEFLTIVGASGSGKSTLLRLIAGLEAPSAGRILAYGSPVEGPSKDRAVVFQDSALYPWLTVWENATFGRGLKANRTETSGELEDRASRLLEAMGLMDSLRKYPAEISGGMAQRLAIARALLAGPKLLLMDEPFGALDAQTREVMQELIVHLFARESMTVVFITHDVEEAVFLGERVLVLAPNPGRVDSVHTIGLPPLGERDFELRMTGEFLAMKRSILERVRATSPLKTGSIFRYYDGIKERV